MRKKKIVSQNNAKLKNRNTYGSNNRGLLTQVNHLLKCNAVI